MLYTGIDHHKRYSVACTLDAQGNKIAQARIDHNDEQAFQSYLSKLGDCTEVMLEACWNWGTLYDLIEDLDGVAKLHLSHPSKNRIIAEAQIKTDHIDAHALATLLRGNFFSPIHVPDKTQRAQKQLLRQRLWLAKQRTMLRNRIHTLIDRHPKLPRPSFKDLFCKQALHWMTNLTLPQPDQQLLTHNLQLHQTLQQQITTLEKQIQHTHADNPNTQALLSIPGIGKIIAPLIALEIDTITRFKTPDKLCAYAGLVPGTHSSGGKTTHGRMLTHSNKWLKWAYIEAAWIAIGCSNYFGQHYRNQRQRGKGANNAITITARRMAKISWQLLTQQRHYQDIPPPHFPRPL